MMAELQGRFVLVVPFLRGHTLEIQGTSFHAEGDRRDSWGGATDDVIAFLSVALAEVPGADPERVATFGYSRGAGVAILHGSRHQPRLPAADS